MAKYERILYNSEQYRLTMIMNTSINVTHKLKKYIQKKRVTLNEWEPVALSGFFLGRAELNNFQWYKRNIPTTIEQNWGISITGIIEIFSRMTNIIQMKSHFFLWLFFFQNEKNAKIFWGRFYRKIKRCLISFSLFPENLKMIWWYSGWFFHSSLKRKTNFLLKILIIWVTYCGILETEGIQMPCFWNTKRNRKWSLLEMLFFLEPYMREQYWNCS